VPRRRSAAAPEALRAQGLLCGASAAAQTRRCLAPRVLGRRCAQCTVTSYCTLLGTRGPRQFWTLRHRAPCGVAGTYRTEYVGALTDACRRRCALKARSLRSLRLAPSAELAIPIQFQAHAWCINWQHSATAEVAGLRSRQCLARQCRVREPARLLWDASGHQAARA